MLQRSIIYALILFLVGCATQQSGYDDSVDINQLPATAAGDSISKWPDKVTGEQWESIRGKSVRHLTRNTLFPSTPTNSIDVSALDFPATQNIKFGRRISAILSPPSDGEYQFWVSADDSAELWLSSDDNPYNKRLIAYTNKPTGYQVWDTFGSQASTNVPLSQGTEYYIEIIHKQHLEDEYLSVSWQGPSFEQQVLTDANLKGFSTAPLENSTGYSSGYLAGYSDGMLVLPYDDRYPTPDSDGDGLPDQYEIAHGLDPNDPSDAASDNDNDQLTALEEYQLLGNPNNADTDGDGLPDSYEALFGLSLANSADAQLDFDGDGFSNLEEFNRGTDPTNSQDIPIIVNNFATLTWTMPDARADGTPLDTSDISAYKLYWGTEADALTNITEITDTSATSYTYNGLVSGTYYFAISVVDSDGIESETSEPVTKQVQ